MGKLLIFLLFAFFSCKQNPQQKNNQIPVDTTPTYAWENILRNADSIVLISHVSTNEYIKIVDDYDISDARRTETKIQVIPAYLKDGKINPVIIKEKIKVDGSKEELINILRIKPENEELNAIRCNDPHHSIIAYKAEKQSYIDICFHCQKINPSSDIELKEINFDEKKWQLLENYFKAQGIKLMY